MPLSLRCYSLPLKNCIFPCIQCLLSVLLPMTSFFQISHPYFLFFLINFNIFNTQLKSNSIAEILLNLLRQWENVLLLEITKHFLYTFTWNTSLSSNFLFTFLPPSDSELFRICDHVLFIIVSLSQYIIPNIKQALAV